MSSYISYISVSLLLLLLLPNSDTFYLPDSNPLLSFNDQVRERHLYTENKRQGLFLEMGTDGTVRGTPEQTANSVLELRSVRAGETVIRGVLSSLYLCVDRTGRLRGERLYMEADCTFNESLLDGYTLFLSKHHGFPVSLAPKLLRDKQFPPFSQFQPLRNLLSSGKEKEERQNENAKPEQQRLDIDSEDPFGMGLQVSVRSPGFHSME
ncbi:fibroblast growth factor 21-like isoform X1 [Anguilla anguilla]|uniref:fibroblast growth factor 21-like isoform X1 n=1 Tax=Anguilla anguilla TaxID=7936 RepID=UPI0015AC2B9E|nr:fibroblast growth factor 21-like isoform X1 [Anguilla anguilla]